MRWILRHIQKMVFWQSESSCDSLILTCSTLKRRIQLNPAMAPSKYYFLKLFVYVMGMMAADIQGIQNVDPFGIEVSSGSVVMLDAVTGKILYAKNPHKVIYPASTTKMATALLSYRLLHNRLDDVVTMNRDMVGAISPDKKRASNYKVPAHWIETASSHMGLKLGEQMNVLDLLRGCLIVSANDASNALALTAGSTYSQFMEKLNAMVKELGCQDSKFINPHGLYQPDQISSAYDLALIGRALIQEPVLKEIVATRLFNRPKTNKQEPALMHNTNLLIQPGKYFSKWASGIKRGYTTQSGSTMISYAQNGERQIILAVADIATSAQCFADSKALIQCAMTEPKVEKCFYPAGTVLNYLHYVRGASRPVQALVKDDVKISIYPSDELSVKGRIHWLELVPPISKNQFVGRVEVVSADGRVLSNSPLTAAYAVEPTLLFQLQHWVSLNPWRAGLLCLAGVGLLAIAAVLRTRSH